MPDYQTIIGLEIHVELNTKSKMFCRCENPAGLSESEYNKSANKYVCPICLGFPGTLPVPNKEAIKSILKVGLALNSTIPEFTKFDRKHYFYPDLPKGYQISQYDLPFCQGGEIEVNRKDGSKFKVEFIRVHLEEDAGKLIHPAGASHSLVDLNRAGVPLMEMVTEPVIQSAEDARIFLQELRLLMRYLGVSNADMEKGQMRCDANINIEILNSKFETNQKFENSNVPNKRTPITEIKNLNSFRMVERALKAEAERQYQEWREGGEIRTRKNKLTAGWNDEKGQILIQRHKEEANDYRYFPEPDLPPFKIRIEDLGLRIEGGEGRKIMAGEGEREIVVREKELPELPWKRRTRYASIGLMRADSETLVTNYSKGNYFDETVIESQSPDLKKKIASIIINELEDYSIQAENLRELAEILVQGKISSKIGKDVLEEMKKNDRSPKMIIEEKGLNQISDQSALTSIIEKVLTDNSQSVKDYQAGKFAAVGALIGAAMRESRGQADPQTVKKMIEEKLGQT